LVVAGVTAASVCTPFVAGIAAIADAPLVPDVFTIADLPPEGYNDFDLF
jgi:hypothetical protein